MRCQEPGARSQVLDQGARSQMLEAGTRRQVPGGRFWRQEAVQDLRSQLLEAGGHHKTWGGSQQVLLEATAAGQPCILGPALSEMQPYNLF